MPAILAPLAKDDRGVPTVLVVAAWDLRSLGRERVGRVDRGPLNPLKGGNGECFTIKT